MRVPVALVVVTLLVWTTRISNIWNDEATTTGDKLASTALAASFTVLAVATAVALWRRAAAAPVLVAALAGWTLVVWVVRMVAIAGSDRGAGFVAVHAVLAVASGALAVAALAGLGQLRATSSASVRHRQPPPALRNSSTLDSTTSKPHASS
ncbi:MAG: hypothetical protein AB7L84_11405 [Acidimicrobiia bacterium]